MVHEQDLSDQCDGLRLKTSEVKRAIELGVIEVLQQEFLVGFEHITSKHKETPTWKKP